MQTKYIMLSHEYLSVGGPINCIPNEDVIKFIKRIQNRIQDIKDNTLNLEFLEKELKDSIDVIVSQQSLNN